MGGSWIARRVAHATGRERRLHSRGISAQQRIYLAAVLILAAAVPLAAQEDIDFDPDITQAEFEKFTRVVAQGIYATPVQPARATGLLGFDIGIAATAVEVDTDASYWQRAIGEDFSTSGYVALPRLVVSKGFSVGTISGSYAKLPGNDVTMLGGALDLPIISGSLVRPTLAARGVYSTLTGVDQLDLKTYGVELFLSKGFGPVTPYGAVGRARSDAEGRIPEISRTLTDKSDIDRYTLGVRFSLLFAKIVVEATQGEERSYAAKVSLGL